MPLQRPAMAGLRSKAATPLVRALRAQAQLRRIVALETRLYLEYRISISQSHARFPHRTDKWTK